MGSSHSAPASPSSSHDVFISFKGQDTRENFVDFLYKALRERIIRIYEDAELHPGDEINSSSILKAIEDSSIAVIIFSKNYADSSARLDELAHIMKCRDERDQVVFPIFWDMVPSDVRKQTGDFGKAFERLVYRQEENITEVKTWRKALNEASSLSGWYLDPTSYGHDSVIHCIANSILNKLCPKKMVGMRARLQDMKSRLEIGSGGVRMIGIWGVGGGGKTTLATSVYQEFFPHFKAHCIVDNIGEESRKYGLKGLQEKILSRVLKTQVEVQSVEEGKQMIKSRLCHSNVLIILNDVDDRKQLEALAGSHCWFGGGSRILITTRYEHLLISHKEDDLSSVTLLSHDEAIQLFYIHTYHENKKIDDYEMLIPRVVSYANGLPLAIIALGSHLYGTDKNEWMSTLARLKDIPETKVTEKLRINYDALNAVEKELFLDIACFYRGKSKDGEMEILHACSFHPGSGLQVLMEKNLITSSEGKFDMHDLIQDMGHDIVRDEYPNNPLKQSRVWQSEKIEDMSYNCDVTMVKENVEIETIRFSGHSSHFPKLVSTMKKLRLLFVTDHPSVNQLDQKDVEGPKFLSNELLRIDWIKYPATPLPENFKPAKLVVLKLHHSLQEVLWKSYKHIPTLKVLDLHGSSKLIMTPDFEGLPDLEIVVLSGCSSLEVVHPSIGYLERLNCLNLDSCDKLQMFPPIIMMKSLETLILSRCSQLRKFPEIKQQMDSLKHLHLDESGIEVLPTSIGRFCINLVSINVTRCNNLRSIDGNFSLFTQKCLISAGVL